MKPTAWLLFLLGIPGVVAAQVRPTQAADSLLTRWQRYHATQPAVLLGVSAGLPLYWREVPFRRGVTGLSALTPYVGYRLRGGWAVQVGFNYSGQYYDEGGFSNPPPSSGLPLSGNWQSVGILGAIPLLVHRPLTGPLLGGPAVEACAGLVPQWQQLNTVTVNTAGPVPTQTEQQRRTFNLHASLGVALVWQTGPDGAFLAEGALARRLFSAGDANTAPALAPTLGVGYRYAFGYQRGAVPRW